MTITRNFKLCLNAGTQNAPYINANQYDEGEEWVFDLYTEGGQKFTPSTGAIIGIKSDGHAILNSGTVNSDGQVVITETQQMTAASGLAVFELLIEGETHGTANFIVNVERRPSDDAEFSDSDLSMLQEAIDSAAEIEDLLGGQDVPTVITPIITDWLDDNITNPSNPPIDTSLTVAGAAADAKKTGNEIADLKSAIDLLIDPHTVTNSGAGGINVDYPMSIGDSIIVYNGTSSGITVRQRDGGGNVLVATDITSHATRKIVSTVNSVDIRFYFNTGGTIYFENADLRVPVIESNIEQLESEVDDNTDTNEFTVESVFDSKLMYHNHELTEKNLLNTDIILTEFDIDEPYTTYYFHADTISNVTSGYPVGIKEYDSNNTLLNNIGRSQNGLLNGAKIAVTNVNTRHIVVWANIGTNPANSIKNLFVWATKSGYVEKKPHFNVYHVEKDGSGDFDSLVDAINESVKYMDSVVYVGAGTWDVIDELGSEYLSNVGDTQRGLYLKNGVHVICDSKAVIEANYAGDLANVKQWLSIFNSGQYGFTLENAVLIGSNIRYLIHDERDTDTDAYTNKYLNCTMVFDNRNNDAWSAKQCIGGGLGQNGYVDIEGCSFKSYQGYDGTVSYHNSAGANAKSHIVLRDCYFYFYNTFRLSWYGTSTEITEALVTGCYLGADIVHRAENSSATVENTSIVSWNNTVNPH